MVIYDLICAKGHRFEGWFPGNKDFDEQKEMGMLECNVCGDHHVEKILSGGHFVRSTGTMAVPQLIKNPPVSVQNAPAASAFSASGNLDSVTVLKAVRHYVTTHFEDVGPDFAKQVREMHNKEIPYKSIYGQANPEDQKKLAEEEVPHFVIPDLPPEFNN